MATIIDEREITITRELAYDIIKRTMKYSPYYSSRVFKMLEETGYEPEDNEQLHNVLGQIENATLERLLLKID